jgi:hypothetical protein
MLGEEGDRPRVVERHGGFDVWFDPVRGIYYASHCEHTKKSASIDEIRRWLDEHKR